MTAIVAYSATEAALADLAAKYKDVVYDVTVPTGMTEAKAAYKDINSHSITLEKAREKEKAESLAYGRRVDAEAKRIADQLDVLRLPIKAQIETETKRAEREREEAVRKEAERIAAEEKARKDAEEAKLAAERAEIARQRAELDKAAEAQREADRQARLKIEEEQRAARLKIEEEERKARLAQQARDEVARVKAEQEAAALKVERDKIEAERRAVEDAQRKERDAKEAEAKQKREEAEAVAREVQRKATELLDARQMLESFCTRFGHLPQFESIVGIIETFLQKKAA